MAVTVTFLGSGDAFGSGGRFQTCIGVELPDATVLLDFGASSLVALKRAGWEPSEVDHVLLSHLHGDHFGGLPFLILDGQFRGRERPLTVTGPPGTRQRVRDAMEVLFPGSSRIERRFDVTFTEAEPWTPVGIASSTLTAVPVQHFSGAPSYGLRLEHDGTVLAYSGDTEWCEELVELSRDADLFICEAYFFDKKVRYHLDYRTLEEHRGRLSAKRLVLTHLNADALARTDELALETASDGLQIVLD